MSNNFYYYYYYSALNSNNFSSDINNSSLKYHWTASEMMAIFEKLPLWMLKRLILLLPTSGIVFTMMFGVAI